MGISTSTPEGTNGWVKVSRELFDYLVTEQVPGIEIEWGSPDADDMYYPLINYPSPKKLKIKAQPPE